MCAGEMAAPYCQLSWRRWFRRPSQDEVHLCSVSNHHAHWRECVSIEISRVKNILWGSDGEPFCYSGSQAQEDELSLEGNEMELVYISSAWLCLWCKAWISLLWIGIDGFPCFASTLVMELQVLANTPSPKCIKFFLTREHDLWSLPICFINVLQLQWTSFYVLSFSLDILFFQMPLKIRLFSDFVFR